LKGGAWYPRGWARGFIWLRDVEEPPSGAKGEQDGDNDNPKAERGRQLTMDMQLRTSRSDGTHVDLHGPKVPAVPLYIVRGDHNQERSKEGD